MQSERAIIVAFAKNRVIGNHGEIPWMGRMPADMKRVRETTKNQAIIMGLNTFKSIGKPLPDRENIVLSNDETIRKVISTEFPKIIFANSLDDAFAKVSRDLPDKIAFIFGGAFVYREAMSRAAELEINAIFATEIHGNFDGDTFFPEIDSQDWRETSRADFAADARNFFPYSFVKYERKAAK